MLNRVNVLNNYENAEEFNSRKLMSSEFIKLGFRTKTLGPLLIVSAEGEKCILREGDTSFTAVTAYHMLKDKRLSRAIFRRAGVSFAEGRTFKISNKEAAREKVSEFGNAVLKPFDGRKGSGVSVNVTPATFEAAWDAALRRTGRRILVEKYFAQGDEARYLVVDSQCIAVAMRVPPTVLGNGKGTVRQLIDAKNELRANNPHLGKRPIFVDDYRRLILASQGFDLDSIPAKGQTVVIDWKSNASTGGETRGITDLVHPSMKRIAERVARAIPGLHVGGVDILSRDHTSKADPQNYIVIEANTLPDLGLHLFPMYGRPVNVCRLIAESCARRMGFEAGRLGNADARPNGTTAVA